MEKVRRIHHDHTPSCGWMKKCIFREVINISVNGIKDYVDDAVLIIKGCCPKVFIWSLKCRIHVRLWRCGSSGHQAYWSVADQYLQYKSQQLSSTFLWDSSSMKTLYFLTSLVLTSISVRGANHFAGFALSNSDTGTAAYTCRTQDQVSEAFRFSWLYWYPGIQWNTIAIDAKSSGFKSIRLTGFDCGALDLASSAAALHGLTILAGLFYSVTPFLLQHFILGRLTLVIEDCCQ